MNERLSELVAKFPEPAAKDGKLADVDKQAADAAVAELLKGGAKSVVGLVEMLAPADRGGDGRVRHAIHALVIRAGARDDDRRMIAEALASTLSPDRPVEVNAFVLGQIQLVGGKEVAPALGKFLADEKLCEAAAAALLGIEAGAAAQFRAALGAAKGRPATIIVHALGALKDTGSAAAIRKLVAADDRDTRLTAARALADIGDADSAELLLKAADAAEGYERSKLTQACLLLAERLAATGQKKVASSIYTRLHETRTDPSEQHVRDAAARGLAAPK
jgi:HEAT repeat protein